MLVGCHPIIRRTGDLMDARLLDNGADEEAARFSKVLATDGVDESPTALGSRLRKRDKAKDAWLHALAADDLDDNKLANALWWGLATVLALTGAAAFALCAASSICFAQSWYDQHHWWPNPQATHHLHGAWCPTTILPTIFNPWKSWMSKRIMLALVGFSAGLVGVVVTRLLLGRVRARLRERRLEERYPWLSRSAENKARAAADTATSPAARGSAPTDTSDVPRVRRPSVSRRDAAATFSAGFTERMAIVHDSTLSVGLDFKGLEVEAGGKRLLTDVTGSVKAGHVTALMVRTLVGRGGGLVVVARCGDSPVLFLHHHLLPPSRAQCQTFAQGPSGAGKSTLLHALCGKLAHQAGKVRVNGSTKATLASLRKLVGFVPQDDTLLATLTVKGTRTPPARAFP